MRATSQEFEKLIAENSTMLVKATLNFADSSTESLDGSDFFSMEFEDATSSDGSFDIGAAIIGQCNVSLNNTEGKFDKYDFTDATIRPYVGKTLSDGTTEWIKMGVFTVDQPDTYSGTIDLECLDNMSKFEKSVDTSSLAFPMTVNALVNHACTACGVDFPQVTLANGSYTIQSAPNLDDAIWLDVLGYACQVTCNWAKCDQNGDLVVSWYNVKGFEGEAWLDDEWLDDGSPYYESGDTADGGDFTFSETTSYDGGDFADNAGYGIINHYSSLELKTDDVVITGVCVTAQNEVTEDGSQGKGGETVLEGSEGYVLAIKSNPLVLYGQAAAVASQVGSACIGMTFRPFSCSNMTDPAIESGDSVLLIGKKGNVYRSYLTSAKLKVNGAEEFSCSAESASRNSAKNAGATTNAYVAARKEADRELSERDKAIERLGEDLENVSGLYNTTVKQSDGSYIYYLHDKKELASSKIVYKVTADAIGISTDGGKTYATGLSANGDAILNRIYAIGINADYINAGTISGRTISGGDFYVKNSSGKIVAKFGASSGSSTGLMVLSPYDNSTFLPLSWHAFTQMQAKTWTNNLFYKTWRYSGGGEYTDSYKFEFTFKTGASGKVLVEYMFEALVQSWVYLNQSVVGDANVSTYLSTSVIGTGSTLFNGRTVSTYASATSDPTGYINLAFDSDGLTSTIVDRQVLSGLSAFTSYTSTLLITINRYCHVNSGSLRGDSSYSLVSCQALTMSCQQLD